MGSGFPCARAGAWLCFRLRSCRLWVALAAPGSFSSRLAGRLWGAFAGLGSGLNLLRDVVLLVVEQTKMLRTTSLEDDDDEDPGPESTRLAPNTLADAHTNLDL